MFFKPGWLLSPPSNRITNQTDAELWKDSVQKDQHWQTHEHSGFMGKMLKIMASICDSFFNKYQVQMSI